MTEKHQDLYLGRLKFNPETAKFNPAITNCCIPEKSNFLDTRVQSEIELVTALPEEGASPTGQFIDIAVHLNNQREEKRIDGLNFHPVHPSCETGCPFLDEKLVRLHAYITESGHKFIYAEELPDPCYSQWDSFRRDVEGIFMKQQLERYQLDLVA